MKDKIYIHSTCQVEQVAQKFSMYLNDCFLKHEIQWGKCIGLYADDAVSLTWHQSGVV